MAQIDPSNRINSECHNYDLNNQDIYDPRDLNVIDLSYDS